MDMESWVREWFDDRAGFEARALPLPADQSESLRNYVGMILTELHVPLAWHTASRMAEVRGKKSPPPDLLTLSGIGEVMIQLVAQAVKDQVVPTVHFDACLEAAIGRVAHLKTYHSCLLASTMVVHYLDEQSLSIRTLSEANGDAVLGVVADAAYRWSVWTFSSDRFERAEARRPVIAKVQHLIDLGAMDLRMLGAKPADGAEEPLAPVPLAEPHVTRPPPQKPAVTASYASNGVPMAPPPPPPPARRED